MRLSDGLDLGPRLFGELAGKTTDWLILVGSSSDGTMEHYSTAVDTHSMCVGPRKRFLGMELLSALLPRAKLPVATVRKGSRPCENVRQPKIAANNVRFPGM